MEKLHLIPQIHDLNRETRNSRNDHKSLTIWFTGLSGSGKSTLANQLELAFFKEGLQVYILDGDNIRLGLNSDLNFSEEGRKENIRRIAEVARLFNDAGIIVISAFISPFKSDRELAKKIIGEDSFIEAYVNTPLSVCEQRDVKGLYRKARNGEIKHFTGIDSPFEEPGNADILLPTHLEEVAECLNKLLNFVKPRIELK